MLILYLRKMYAMRFLMIIMCAFLSFESVKAQKNPVPLDKSPMDVSYFPQDYPVLKMNAKTNGDLVARVLYSRPEKAGRNIFGGIVKYDEIWRLGANEATEIDIFKPVKINGKTIPKGRYSMYAICSETHWTIIFNTETDVWGLLYNPKKDFLRVNVPVKKEENCAEAFTMLFEPGKGGASLNIFWDTTSVSVPMSF